MAALGKRVVTAGTGHYAGHGFTADPRTRADYERIVLDPTRLPPMTADEHDRALRFAYWLFERKAYRFDTYRAEYSDAADVYHPLNGRARILSPTNRARSGVAWRADCEFGADDTAQRKQYEGRDQRSRPRTDFRARWR